MREVVIEMKVRLLKELTVDHKVEPRAQQFVALLLSEYSDLCACSQRASFLSTFVCSLSLLLTITTTSMRPQVYHLVLQLLAMMMTMITNDYDGSGGDVGVDFTESLQNFKFAL